MEGSGEPVLAVLVEVLDRPTAVLPDSDLHVWPSAFAYDTWEAVPPEEREALRPLYDEAGLASFAEYGSYIGYRVGITTTGTWRYFVAGD